MGGRPLQARVITRIARRAFDTAASGVGAL
jgi:hypothetical protein